MRPLVLALALLFGLPASALAAPPVVTLDSPGAGAVAGVLQVRATASDDVAVSRVEFTVRGAKLVDTTAPFGGNFDTANVKDGPAAVTATAFDGDGGSSGAAVDVVIDNTAPEVVVDGPAGEAFAPGSPLTWTIGARDAASGVSAVRCSLVAFGADPVFGPCSGGLSSHSASGLPVGRYTFIARAVDGAGNGRGVFRSFRVEEPVAGAPVTTGPVSAPAVAAPKPPQITVALAFRFASTARATRLSQFFVRNVPNGATVTVRCPTGCARKVFKKTVKSGGRLALKPLVKRPLKRGTTIAVVVSKPGASSAVKVLTIRARKAPVVVTQCQPEGAPKPLAC